MHTMTNEQLIAKVEELQRALRAARDAQFTDDVIWRAERYAYDAYLKNIDESAFEIVTQLRMRYNISLHQLHNIVLAAHAKRLEELKG